MTYSKQFLEKTIEVWQDDYDYPLTLEDAREIADNMVSLVRWIEDDDRSRRIEWFQDMAKAFRLYFMHGKPYTQYYIRKPLCIVQID